MGLLDARTRLQDPFDFPAAGRAPQGAEPPPTRGRAAHAGEMDRLPPAAPRPRPGLTPWLEEPATPPARAARGPERRDAERGGAVLALSEVRAIFEEGRFWTEYQAIVDARSGRTAGFEALGRFTRSDGTPVPPARVFALLHADPALLVRAELRLKLHQIQHAPDAPLFINLDAGSWIRAAHADGNPFAGLISSAPRRVVIEITESAVAENALRAAEVMASLRDQGFTVALDDLGAANALFSFDAVADTDVLKFDRAVVARLGDPRCRAFVQTLITMTHETGAYTVLEGVERPEELVAAREIGFDFVQGYLFADRTHASTQ